MSLFANSSGINIYGGIFTAGGTQVLGKRKDRDSGESDDYAQDDDLRKRRRCSSLDGLMIVKADDVDLQRELIRGIGYRIHTATHHGRLVAFKAFEGPRAKQDWTVDVAFSKEAIHSNVLKIVGVSDERSKSHFVLFRGITSEQKMQSLIAKALRTDLNTSVQISMKAVKGIAAGLSYIKSKNIPMYPGTMNNNLKWENFNIFTGYDDEPIISFDPSCAVHENGTVSQTFDDEIDGSGVEVLSGVCQQLFSGANSILYDDSPEREFDVYDREGFPRAPPSLEDTKGTSNVSGSKDSDMSSSSNSTEKPKSSRPPRREVWWHDLGAKNLSLESIKRRFEDCLDRFLSSSSDSLLRHITSPMDSRLRHNLHQCPGYLREEIALVSDVSKSVIISHAFPSQSEVCSMCGQLVQYKYTEPPIVDVEMQEVPANETQISNSTSKAKRKAKDKDKEKEKQESNMNLGDQDVPSVENQVQDPPEEEEQGITRCVCGSAEDNPDAGDFMIQCETCRVWQHGLCMGYQSEVQVHDDDYYCEQCRPELHIELLKKLAKRPRQISAASRQDPANSRFSRSHSPGHNIQPSKRRNTMNSRDAAFDESLKEIIEATAAEAAAVRDSFLISPNESEPVEVVSGGKKKRGRT